MKPHTLIICLLLLVVILQCQYYYDRMPEKMASHFDGSGRANGWSSRSGFIAGYILMIMLMVAVFLGLPHLLSRLPARLVNLPNRDYWLAPERRATTWRIISEQMAWFGTATIAFLIAIFQLTLQANLKQDPVLPGQSFWFIFAAYMLCTLIWTVRFVTRFTRTA